MSGRPPLKAEMPCTPGVAGSFNFTTGLSDPEDAPPRGLHFICPCGCGAHGAVQFRANAYDQSHPSWEWDGNRESPTLSPSIQRTTDCRWHGWLRDGFWVSA